MGINNFFSKISKDMKIHKDTNVETSNSHVEMNKNLLYGIHK